MIKNPTSDELFEAAVHCGHKVGKLHPRMNPYIHTIKNNLHLVDLEKTKECLEKAFDFIKEVVAKNGKILFVGTKPIAQAIVKKYAQEVEMPYIVERWLGGTLTNFSIINKLVRRLKKMEEEKIAGDWEKYTKKEKLDLEKEIEKLNRCVGGIRDLEKLPEAIFLIDTGEEKTALREAKRTKVKIIGLVDVNCDPTKVDFPIPGNDDASKSIELITSFIVEVIKEGKKIKLNKQQEAKPKTSPSIQPSKT